MYLRYVSVQFCQVSANYRTDNFRFVSKGAIHRGNKGTPEILKYNKTFLHGMNDERVQFHVPVEPVLTISRFASSVALVFFSFQCAEETKQQTISSELVVLSSLSLS